LAGHADDQFSSRSPATDWYHNVPPPPAVVVYACSQRRRCSQIDEPAARQRFVRLESILRRNQPGWDHDGVPAGKLGRRQVERRPTRLRSLQIAEAVADPGSRRASHLKIRRAPLKVVCVASQEEQSIAALRHSARQRPTHASRGPKQHDFHVELTSQTAEWIARFESGRRDPTAADVDELLGPRLIARNVGPSTILCDPPAFRDDLFVDDRRLRASPLHQDVERDRNAGFETTNAIASAPQSLMTQRNEAALRA
jgi:hypothetical protein